MLPGTQPVSIYYPINDFVAEEYREGQWYANVFPTIISDITPLSDHHGICNVKYRQENYTGIPYRSHGLDPNTLDWGNNLHFYLRQTEFTQTGDQIEYRQGIDWWNPNNNNNNNNNDNDTSTTATSTDIDNNEGYATQHQEHSSSSDNEGYATQPPSSAGSNNNGLNNNNNMEQDLNSDQNHQHNHDAQADESSSQASRSSSDSVVFSSKTEDDGEDLHDSTTGSNETDSRDDVDSHSSFLDSRNASKLSMYSNASTISIDKISFEEDNSSDGSSNSGNINPRVNEEPGESSSSSNSSDNYPGTDNEVTTDHYNADNEQSDSNDNSN